MTACLFPLVLWGCGGGPSEDGTDGEEDTAFDHETAGDADVIPDIVVDEGTDPGPDAAGGIIHPDRRIQWRPGVPGGIPDVSLVCPAGAPSVMDFGAAGDGATDDQAAFTAAIDAAPEGSAVRVPEGTYLLLSGLTIDKGVVLCGEGPLRSRLQFDCDEVGIDIVTYDRGDFVPVTSGFTAGSNQLTVEDASSFTAGRYAEMQQTNNWDIMDPENIWRNDAWAPESCVGQMMRVVAVSGNVLTVQPPIHMDFDAAFDPVIRSMGLVEGAGLQGLYMARMPTYDQATVEIKNAAGCWIRDCLSENTSVAHVNVSSALWCEIRDSFMHHAYDYGGGGHGYGANLGNHTTACLTENNIFVHLRHSMLVQVGATGNVFGYNYSIDPFQSEGGDWTPCDISLHGHYANMNLFEGNTVQEIDVSDYWGPCGPGNTFLRNRVESEGIEVMDYSHRQNVVGNELGTDPDVIAVDGTVNDTLVHGNYENGAIGWDPGISERELPASLYLESKPAFFGDTPWPVTGADLAPGAGIVPAQQRYEAM